MIPSQQGRVLKEDKKEINKKILTKKVLEGKKSITDRILLWKF